MGFNIVKFSKTRKFKILWISMVVVGGFFLLIGGMMSLFSSFGTTQDATNFHLQASGPRTVEDRYYVTVYKKSTPVVVYTDPVNVTKKRISFEVTDGGIYLDGTPKSVYAGGTTNIVLKTDANGDLHFGKEIRITVRHGQVDRYLFVTIAIPEERVKLDCSIGYRTSLVSETLQNISAPKYTDEVFAGDQKNGYSLDAKLLVDSTVINGDVKWASECIAPLNIPIDLFHKSSPSSAVSNILIPTEVLSFVVSSGNPFIVKFKITATYTLGDIEQEYIDFFQLTIVP